MSERIVEVRQPGCRAIHVLVRDQLEVGRECDGLHLIDEEVSRRHLRLELIKDALWVADLDSTNGTKVNGSLVTDPVPVSSGDVVRLGDTELVVLPEDLSALRVTPKRRETIQSEQTPLTRASAKTKVLPRVGGAAAPDHRTTSILNLAAVVQDEPSAWSTLRRVSTDVDTMTIVFSDIESSTQQALRLGDQRWFEVLGTHNQIVRNALRRFDGTEVKAIGDGFMLTFSSARRAVRFCMTVQQELRAWARETPDDAVGIRMGAHTGEAMADESGDLFGKHIIVASRVANLARGGEILVTKVVREITSSRGDLQYGPARTVDLKGIDSAYEVFEVMWQA